MREMYKNVNITRLLDAGAKNEKVNEKCRCSCYLPLSLNTNVQPICSFSLSIYLILADFIISSLFSLSLAISTEYCNVIKMLVELMINGKHCTTAAETAIEAYQ